MNSNMKSFGITSKWQRTYLRRSRQVTVSIPLLKSDISRTHYTRIKFFDLLISSQGITRFQAHDKVVIIVIEANISGVVEHTRKLRPQLVDLVPAWV